MAGAREGYLVDSSIVALVEVPARELLSAGAAVSSQTDPDGKGGGPVAVALQAIIREASRQSFNDGELVDALAHAAAGCLAQTANPSAAYNHFVHMTAHLTERLARIIEPKGSA